MINNSIQIETLTEKDEKDVAGFIDQSLKKEFPDTYHHLDADDLDNLKNSYNGKRDLFLVAKKDNSIVGTIAIKEENEEVALLRRLFIAQEYRSKGFGSALIQKAVDFCKNQNYAMVSFRGNNQMDKAIRAIERNGFIRKDLVDFGGFHIYIYVKLL